MASTKKPGAVASAKPQGCASTPPARPSNSSETQLDQLPILIGEFEANARETARVTLEKYRGYDLVCIGKWYVARDGELKPGRGGFKVQVRHLPVLKELINLAYARAIEVDLLPNDEGGGR